MADRLLNGAVALLAAGLAAALLWTVATVQTSGGLTLVVRAHLPDSGVDSAVTAVLLNFRAFDTLLEVGVLLLAVVASFALHPDSKPSPAATAPLVHGPEPSPILLWVAPRLVPFGMLMAGYLWWAGSSRAGGAFQAGTVLGATLLLLFLSGRSNVMQPARRMTRLWLCGGLLLFLAAGAATPLLDRGAVLELPPKWSGPLIILIEAGLTLSIGACLAALVIGVPVSPPERSR